MKALQEKIYEFEKLANMDVQEYDCSDVVSYDHAYDIGDDRGTKRTAKEALFIINQLQEERDRYKSLWETNAVEGEEIIKELKGKLKEMSKCRDNALEMPWKLAEKQVKLNDENQKLYDDLQIAKSALNYIKSSDNATISAQKALETIKILGE